MSLSTQSLFDTALVEVGGGVGDARFNSAFINACNCALDELSDEADLATRHTHITTVNTSITTLQTGHWYILHAGITFYLIRTGWRPSDPRTAGIVYQDSDKEWDKAKAKYLTRILNELQTDTTADITKLGYVGTDT
jgi:hypothetical protein